MLYLIVRGLEGKLQKLILPMRGAREKRGYPKHCHQLMRGRVSSSPASAPSACLWEVRMSEGLATAMAAREQWVSVWEDTEDRKSSICLNKFCSESTLIMSNLFVSPTKLA